MLDKGSQKIWIKVSICLPDIFVHLSVYLSICSPIHLSALHLSANRLSVHLSAANLPAAYLSVLLKDKSVVKNKCRSIETF